MVPSKSITWSPDSVGKFNCELWVDPYYTAFNVSRSLTEAPIARLVSDGERATDWWLWEHLGHPRDVLVEVSVNPIPIGGWSLRKWAPEGYSDANYQGTNLVQAVTQGFPEPWALSLFFGNVVSLVSSSDTNSVNGMGYSGFLLTWGGQNIVDNLMIPDNWIEAEVKIKGDDIRTDRKMGWSFRGGLREHFNPNIRDAVFFSIYRHRTDFQYSGWNPLRNSSLEFRIDVDQASFANVPNFELLKWSAIAGKKFPFAKGKMAWSLSFGVVQELFPGYTGALRSKASKGWKLVLQPNLEW